MILAPTLSVGSRSPVWELMIPVIWCRMRDGIPTNRMSTNSPPFAMSHRPKPEMIFSCAARFSQMRSDGFAAKLIFQSRCVSHLYGLGVAPAPGESRFITFPSAEVFFSSPGGAAPAVSDGDGPGPMLWRAEDFGTGERGVLMNPGV
jgi:hypothetical protein